VNGKGSWLHAEEGPRSASASDTATASRLNLGRLYREPGLVGEAFDQAERPDRPGPLPATHDFLKCHPSFEVDHEKCDRFLISHDPLGWLKRITPYPPESGSRAPPR
jgi:hypothetical protein